MKDVDKYRVALADQEDLTWGEKLMFTKSYNKIRENINGRDVIIVGAGKYGRELAGALIDDGQGILCFFDNCEDIHGLTMYGIEIKPIQRIDGSLYIVSLENDLIRYKLKMQLQDVGIKQEDIMCYYPHRCLDYHSELKPDEYKDAIEEMYYEKLGKKIDWKNPKTYSEKINCEKISIQDKRRVMLADKSLARKWVEEKIGSDHITMHYGIWDSAEDIDFDSLPDKFVLKATSGSGRNILVKDKSKINIPEVKLQLDYWMSSNYMFESFEMHYGKIRPRIIAEEYIDGLAESLYDYNIYCFHGEPEYVWCIKGSHREGCCATFYDKEWNAQPFSFGYPLDIYPAPKPEKLNEMLDLTRILCKEFEHVRVDWYILPDGRILFGEMTFQTWGGINTFIPGKYDEYFGSLI